MRLSITHSSQYLYSRPASYGLLRIRLKPKSTHGQKVLDWSMELDGAALETRFEDHNNNSVTLASVEPGTQQVSIICKGVIDTSDHQGVIGKHAGFMPDWAFAKQTGLTRPDAEIRRLANAAKAEHEDPLDSLHYLSAQILEAVTYETGQTTPSTTAAQAMAAGKGVCQDHAHIFLSAARHLGIPARYVSGYLMMNDRMDQEAGHAWAEAYLPYIGWVGFDISNGISPDERYVRVATGCDYSDAAPIAGISNGTGENSLNVQLWVEQQTVEQ